MPGMFVTMQFMDTRAQKSLLFLPKRLSTGARARAVMLAEDTGTVRPVEVEAGIESPAGQRKSSAACRPVSGESSRRNS